MTWKKLSNAVSYWSKPVLGTFSGKKPIMALAVDKNSSNPYLGLARVIIKRKGNPNMPGFLDRSKLIIVDSKNGLKWEKRTDLKIKGIDKIINNRVHKDRFFIGLEDPDIFVERGIRNVYFTIAFKIKNKKGYEVFLGHAQGKSLYDLTATIPTLHPLNKFVKGFKEVTISPVKFNGFRISLNEELVFNGRREISVISASKAKSLEKEWEYLKIVLNPKNIKYSWINNEASPCCFIPIKNKNLLVGIVNGREPTKTIN